MVDALAVGEAVLQLVAGEDQADHAVAAGDLGDRVAIEHVGLPAEAVAGVRGDHREVLRVGAVLAVERVEQLERLGDGVGAHVADVDEDAVLVHRAHRGVAELGQAGAARLVRRCR